MKSSLKMSVLAFIAACTFTVSAQAAPPSGNDYPQLVPMLKDLCPAYNPSWSFKDFSIVRVRGTSKIEKVTLRCFFSEQSPCPDGSAGGGREDYTYTTVFDGRTFERLYRLYNGRPDGAFAQLARQILSFSVTIEDVPGTCEDYQLIPGTRLGHPGAGFGSGTLPGGA